MYLYLERPPTTYCYHTDIGLFAGGTKPKPFQRRRANLSSTVPDGHLPALGTMRAAAIAAHSSLAKPLRPGTHSTNNSV
jgi:hypothetical protein